MTEINKEKSKLSEASMGGWLDAIDNCETYSDVYAIPQWALNQAGVSREDLLAEVRARQQRIALARAKRNAEAAANNIEYTPVAQDVSLKDEFKKQLKENNTFVLDLYHKVYDADLEKVNALGLFDKDGKIKLKALYPQIKDLANKYKEGCTFFLMKLWIAQFGTGINLVNTLEITKPAAPVSKEDKFRNDVWEILKSKDDFWKNVPTFLMDDHGIYYGKTEHPTPFMNIVDNSKIIDLEPNVYSRTPEEVADEIMTEFSKKTESLTEAKRYVRRYYIRPQNIFCSNKDEVLKALIELDDENCSVYTLNNLIDNDDVTKLTNKDIIYYYDDGKLYDKNKVKVMDYDLAIKHEEKRDAIDADKVSDATFNDVYDDRMTDRTVVESLDEAVGAPSYRALDDGHIDYNYAYSKMDRFMMCDDQEAFDKFYNIHNIDEMEKFLDEYIDEEEFMNRAGDGATIRDFAQYIIDNHLNESLNEENELDLMFEDVDVYGNVLTEAAHKYTCCICGEEFEGYGNNPEPYMPASAGECCDACNLHFVIAARLDQIKEKEDEE